MTAAAGDWTVVRRRGRRRGDAPNTTPRPDAPPPLPVTPIPWSPSDLPVDPAAVSRLVARVNDATSRVAGSGLYRRMLLPVPPPPRASRPHPPLPPRRRQLRVLPRRALLPDSADLFDPVLSAAECAAAAALGFSVPGLDDGGRRRVDEPTLFYMPHCEASLYDALLAANWEPPAQLRQVCVLGNSFRRYAIQAEENQSGPAAKAKHVLAAERLAWEQRVDGAGDLDEDDWFTRAFNETSWHFFQVDDDMDLATEGDEFKSSVL
jgi:hypothetical protein